MQVRGTTPDVQGDGFREEHEDVAVQTMFDWMGEALGHPIAAAWDHHDFQDNMAYPSIKRLGVHFVCIPRMLLPFVDARSSHYVNLKVADPRRAS